MIPAIMLVVCGVVTLASATYIGIPTSVLYCIAEILCIKTETDIFHLSCTEGTNRKECSQIVEGLNRGRKNNAN